MEWNISSEIYIELNNCIEIYVELNINICGCFDALRNMYAKFHNDRLRNG